MTGHAKPMATTHSRLYNGDTFEYQGYTFKVEYNRDDDMQAPWEEHDGHGIVSDWTSRDKAPGERVLSEDRGSRRYYDVQASMRKARKEQWGPIHCATCGQESSSEQGWEAYTKGTHATPMDHPFVRESAGKQAARAVEADYEYLRAWCHDEWEWTYAVVMLLDDDGDETRETASLGGIDGDHGTYLTDVAYELAEEIVHRIEVANPDIQVSEN